MKSFIVFLLLALSIIVYSCSNETSVNQISGTASHGTVTGYVSYFSPEVLPRHQPSPYPPGYVLSNFSWLAGSPTGPYDKIYLQGRENELANAIRITATGEWFINTAMIGPDVYRFVILSIDSLTVLE